MMILEFFDLVIEELKEQGRIGYSAVFAAAKSSLKKYLISDKLFINFIKKDFEEYEKYLRISGISESTISVYIRTFNRFWNMAIASVYCPKEHLHLIFLHSKLTDDLKQENEPYQPK